MGGVVGVDRGGGDGGGGGGDKQVKVALRDIGMRHDEAGILLSACDNNSDGYLDTYELDHLRRLAQQAITVHTQQVSCLLLLLPHLYNYY